MPNLICVINTVSTKKSRSLNKLLPLLCWIGAVKTPQENHHHSTSFDASEGEVAVCTGWEQRTEKQFKNSRSSCSSGESLFSTCNKRLKRKEKSLRRVAMVAIFLDDNKPKVALFQTSSMLLNFNFLSNIGKLFWGWIQKDRIYV